MGRSDYPAISKSQLVTLRLLRYKMAPVFSVRKIKGDHFPSFNVAMPGSSSSPVPGQKPLTRLFCENEDVVD